MKKKQKWLQSAGLFFSFLGMVASFVLILEFFDSGNSIASGLCGAGENGEISSCQKVAESSYSGFRDLPLLGDVPLALFGFVFYGIVFLVLLATRFAKWSKDRVGALGFLISISAFGLLVDLGLFMVSIFVINAICKLCVSTYILTILLLVVLYLLIQEEGKPSKGVVVKTIQTQFSNLLILFLGLFVVGSLLGKATSPQDSKLVSNSELKAKLIKEKIKVFDLSPSLGLDTKGFPSLGDPKAPITIVKYADFNCGHCNHASHVLGNVLVKYDGLVRVVYKNFPLDGNCNRLVVRKNPEASSCVATSASICADRQSRFKEVYNALYSDNDKGIMHTTASVLKLAQLSGLDMKQFRSCMGSPQTQAQIEKEVNEADRLKIQATPSIFVNDKALESGVPDEEFLNALIDHLLKKT